LASFVGDLTRAQLLAALEAAAHSDQLETLVDLALRQDVASRQRIVTLIAETDRLDDFAALLTENTPQIVWDALVEVRAEMPAAVREVVRGRAGELDRTDVSAAMDDAPPMPARARPRPGPRRSG
jgi:hypothetical protein